MAEVLFEEGSVLGQDYVAAGESAGKLRTEKCRVVEDHLVAGVISALEESHAETRSLAAEAHTVGLDAGSMHSDAGSHCTLVEAAEAAVADTVGLADWIGFADNVVLLVGLVELGDTAASIGHAAVADKGVLGTADYAGIVALSSLVAVADTGVAVFDTVRSADTAENAGTVGLVHTAEIVDNAEVAADTADIVATTDW